MTSKFDMCPFLARPSSLLYLVLDVTEWDIRSWYWRRGLSVGQHLKVVMSAHVHKSVAILIGHKTATNKPNCRKYLMTTSESQVEYIR